MKRHFLKLFCGVLGVSLLFLCTRVLSPKYIENPEGRLISEYYREADAGRTHSVIFLGDCEVYESFVPPILWERYGITSFVRGSAGQTLTHSRYLLEETLKQETPSVVVLGVYAARYSRASREEYNRMTLDGMRPSLIKHRAVKDSMLEGESLMSYYFPILRYHSRWKEVGLDDIRHAFDDVAVSHNGYLLQTGIIPQIDSPSPDAFADDLSDIALDQIRHMASICSERGIRLVLVKAPVCSERYWWYGEWEEEIGRLALELGLDYYDLLDHPIGIDMQTDSYDGGMHLNVYGAIKVSEYFGRILSEEYRITDRRQDADVRAVWDEKLKCFYRDVENS